MEATGQMDESIEDILKRLPCLFLLNKNDRLEFKGLEYITKALELDQINCIDTKALSISALDMNGVDTALNWVYKAVVDNTIV